MGPEKGVWRREKGQRKEGDRGAEREKRERGEEASWGYKGGKTIDEERGKIGGGGK